MELARQDRNGTRVPADVERRYKLGKIDPLEEDVEKLKDDIVVDDKLSTTSTHAIQNKVVTLNLDNKVTKENGKGLSTNDFTDEYKEKINNSAESDHSHDNKEVLDDITLTDTLNWDTGFDMRHEHENKSVLDEITGTEAYNLSNYAVTGLTILRSSCIKKNNRVCINFVGTLPMQGNITTKLFTLPESLRPTATRDFVVYGQDSNTSGYLGYGYLTNSGAIEVRFTNAVSSYIRFSFVYDI